QPELQERVLRTFHFALKPGGFLLLGKAESIGTSTALFEPASPSTRLFRRIGGRSHLPRSFGHRGDSDSGLHVSRRGSRRAPSSAEILRTQLGERQVTAAALLDRDGRALHFQGQLGQFLAPQGDATLELSLLVRPELRAALRNVQRQVGEGAHSAFRLAILTSPPGLRRVRVDVELVPDADGRGLMLVLLTAVPSEGAGLAPDESLGAAAAPPSQQEFDDSRQELMLALEDAEHSNEDLR